MAGRKMGTRHQDDVRAKIQASHIVRRFQEAFDGKIVLTPDQINIGKALLNKSVPDLKAVEHSGETTSILELSGLQWLSQNIQARN